VSKKEVRGNASSAVELQHNPHQAAFLAAINQKTAKGANAFHRLGLFAGRQGGKTRIGAVAASAKMQVPNSWGWICAPTYPDLHDFVMPAIFSTIPHAWIGNWSEENKELELKNYAKVQFRSLDDPDKARGPTLDWAWIDEACKVAALAWKTMIPTLLAKNGQAWITTSPRSFDWAYEEFWLKAKAGIPGYWAIKYKSSENPIYHTPEGRAALADARSSMDPTFAEQELDADFVSFTGAIYGAALNQCILRDDAQIRKIIPEWPRINADRACYVGIDPGADHPFAFVMLVATEYGLVLVGEVLERNKEISEYVRRMHEQLGKFNPGRPFVPEVWAIDRSQKQFSIELAQHRIYATAAENSVENGIRRVQTWISSKRFYIVEALCPRTIEQLRGYRWAENTKADGQAMKEKVIKTHDDLPDALRYVLMAGPTLPDIDMAPSDGRRDLTDQPEEVRWMVERMRKCARPRAEDSSFFGSEEDATPGLIDAEDEAYDHTSPAGNFWQ
jgi:hypothetical protein